MDIPPQAEPVRIRPAVPEDAPAIAQVRIDSWGTTYRGLISDQYLDQMNLEYYTQSWESILTSGRPQGYAFVAQNNAGEVVGFVIGGPERTLNRFYLGEIYAIYLLDAYQQQGLGRRLIAAVVRELLDEGIESMLIWVLAANPAVNFYQALGGEPVLESEIVIGGDHHRQIAYGYSDIHALALQDESIE